MDMAGLPSAIRRLGAMTQNEIDDAAADAFSDMCEGEPPVTMQERYQAAWREHQEAHR